VRRRSEWLVVDDAVCIAATESVSVEGGRVLSSDRAVVVVVGTMRLHVGRHCDRSSQLRPRLMNRRQTL